MVHFFSLYQEHAGRVLSTIKKTATAAGYPATVTDVIADILFVHNFPILYTFDNV